MAKGIVKNPWGDKQVTPEPPRALASNKTFGLRDLHDYIEDPENARDSSAIIDVKGYGGVTVQGISNTAVAGAQILEFCIQYNDIAEPILLKYGLLLTQLAPGKTVTASFFILREDNWLLAAPGATTRDEGCLQLIQALLDLQNSPAMKQAMSKYNIRVYKL